MPKIVTVSPLDAVPGENDLIEGRGLLGEISGLHAQLVRAINGIANKCFDFMILRFDLHIRYIKMFLMRRVFGFKVCFSCVTFC